MKHEWCLYVYDFLLMFICLATCHKWYTLDVKQHARQTDSAMGLVSMHTAQAKSHA